MSLFRIWLISVVVQVCLVAYAVGTQQWGYLAGTATWAAVSLWAWRYCRRHPEACR